MKPTEQLQVRFPGGCRVTAYNMDEALIIRHLYPYGRIYNSAGEELDQPMCQDYQEQLKQAWSDSGQDE